MRISLKQTILLSTSLFTMNLSLLAMERDTIDKSIGASSLVLESSADMPPVVSAPPVSARAKKMSQNFFGEEVPASFPVFQLIDELIGERKAAAAVSASEQLTRDTASFTSGTLTLTAAHPNLAHQAFNAIYTELGDNFLETVLPDGVEGRASGTQEAINRLTKIHRYFKALIDDTSGKIQRHSTSLTVVDTEATRSDVEKEIAKYNVLNQSLKGRFLNLLHHFSATRKFIIQANKTIAAKRTVIVNASSKDMAVGIKGESSSLISTELERERDLVKKLERDIVYLKKLIIEAETFIHALYDFNRTTQELEETSNVFGKAVVAARLLANSAAGVVTNTFNRNRTLRCDMTGQSALPHSITISGVFDTKACYDATDEAIHSRYMEYLQKILKPTPALFDAIADGRLRFDQLPAVAQKAELSATSAQSSLVLADSKVTISDNGDADKKEAFEEKGAVLQVLAAASTAADLISTVVSTSEAKDSSAGAASAMKQKVREKKK